MILSEQVQKVLTYIQSIEIEERPYLWETGRDFYEKFSPLAGIREDVFLIEERTLVKENHSVRLRIYRPNNQDKLPVIIYFHGGWFDAGSLETHDNPLRQLCNLSQVIIIAVDYRLAPEHPFPAGLNDCAFGVRWVIENASSLKIDHNKISIAGDSAGGALAATITRKFRKAVNAQLLIYPVTDNSLQTPSWNKFPNGPLLGLKAGIQAWDLYLPNAADRNNMDAVTLLADDLENLPPTFIAVAGYDPLKDEAIQYAEKLEKNDIEVNLIQYEGTTHGFFQMGGFIEDTKVLMLDMAEFIKTQSSLK